MIKISKVVARRGGTTANLRDGDILTLEQLMYGMMLPSGNDAAYAIAEYFGQQLYDRKYSNMKEDEIKLFEKSDFNGTPVKYFLKEMNF